MNLEKTISTQGLKTAYRNINNGARYSHNGNWTIALGGYDTGYVVSLDTLGTTEEIFRVNYNFKEYEVLKPTSKALVEKIKAIMNCTDYKDNGLETDAEDKPSLYMDVIIERFVDDCRTFTMKDPDGNEIERCSKEKETLTVRLVNGKTLIIQDQFKAIDFVSDCTLEDN